MTALPKILSTPLPNFSKFEPHLEANWEPWLADLKKKAFVQYHESGFPSSRLEEWKYSSVSPLTRLEFVPFLPNTELLASEAFWLEPWDGPRLVFVNGAFAPALSQSKGLPDGVTLVPFSQAGQNEKQAIQKHLLRGGKENGQFFTALNTAYFEEGVLLEVSKGVHVKAPIQILSLSVGIETSAVPMQSPRNLVLMGANSEATLVEESYGQGEGMYLVNGVMEVELGDHAVLRHCRLQKENRKATHLSSIRVHQRAHSHYESHVVCLQGGLLRNELRVQLDGEGSRCTLNGLFVSGAKDNIENLTVVEHAKPHCESHEVYKGIVSEQATGSFTGRIVVQPGAQKTNASQLNRNLLLSETGTINSKPQLEIYADDVRCSHGSATGTLDESSLFYFRARGIGKEEARTILVRAFAEELIDRIPVEALRRRVSENLLFESKGEKA